MGADIATDDIISPPKSRNDPCPCGSGKRYKQCHGVPARTGSDGSANYALAGLMAAALAAQRGGELAEAERLYREALALAPDQPDCLHMLGVVRMNRLDLEEGRALIARAGELVHWRIDSFRHNYGFLLSALLSGREPTQLSLRIDALRAERSARPQSPDRRYAVIVVAAGAAADALHQTCESLLAVAMAPTTVVLAGADRIPDALPGRGSQWHATTWSHEAAADSLQLALARCTEPFVAVLHAGDLAVELPEAVTALATSGADWAIARAETHADAVGNYSPVILRNLFALLRHSDRLGAALFAESGAIGPVCNVLWSVPFLRAKLAARVSHFAELCELAMWHNEPVFVDRLVGRLPQRKHADSSFWSDQQASSEHFLALALSGQRAPNPVAPTLELDGASFLKRALRLGLGRRVGARTLQQIAQLATAPGPQPPSLRTDGVEWIGFVRAEIGLGESLRLMAQACIAEQIPLALTNIPLDMGVQQTDRSLREYEVTQPTFRTRVISTNPDTLGEGNFVDGAFALPNAYNVGYWYWELEQLPPAWLDFDRVIDELWVATDFVADAARKGLTVPVIKITPPIVPPRLSRTYRRDEFGLEDGVFSFMFSFDFGSFPARKNPEAVVKAFRAAFPPERSDVSLVLKCHRGHLFPAARAALMASVDGDRRITILDRTLSRDELTGLQSLIDCYVSLHRSEGLGLGMAECMALGKPVIATAYSGNLEFTRGDNSLLVDYTLVAVKPDECLLWRDQHWAEPSYLHAAQHMRALADDRALANRIGMAGQRTILNEYSPAAVGARVRARLDAINAKLDAGGTRDAHR